jgi:starch-binding outer membrane protein, SusD/RagB family
LTPIRLATALLTVAMLGCKTDDLLQVTDPDVARPDALTGVAAIPTLRAGAIGDFGVAFNGSNADVEQVHMSAMIADEFINTETFPTRIEIDQRAMSLTNTSLNTTFYDLQRARASAERAIGAYKEFAKTAADSAGYPEVLALASLSYSLFAENYCGAVPASAQLADGSLEFGPPLSTTQLLDSAVSKANQALAVTGAPLTATFRQLAQVAKGRALLNKGDYAGAAAAVAGVATTFQYNYSHSETSGRQNNGTWLLTQSVGRFGVANAEAGIGLPFQSEGNVKAAVYDPRVADSLARRGTNTKGFDGTTDQWVQAKYPARASSITIADGVEARLIEAEAALKAGDAAGALGILNTLRSTAALLSLRGYTAPTGVTFTLATPLSLQATPEAQLDQLMKERAYWLFLTSHRLGDLRRLVRQYGRPVNSVFPNGPYFKGGTYGNNVNAPVPFSEQNNPSYTPGSCNQATA